jgi:hypothetical protein
MYIMQTEQSLNEGNRRVGKEVAKKQISPSKRRPHRPVTSRRRLPSPSAGN